MTFEFPWCLIFRCARSTSIFQFLMWVVMWTTVRETYAPVILRRRARKLRRETGNSNYKTAYERLEDQKPLAQVLTQALTRPLRLLLFHPCLQIVAAIEGFGYGLLYIVLARFATVVSILLWTLQLTSLNRTLLAVDRALPRVCRDQRSSLYPRGLGRDRCFSARRPIGGSLLPSHDPVYLSTA